MANISTLVGEEIPPEVIQRLVNEIRPMILKIQELQQMLDDNDFENYFGE